MTSRQAATEIIHTLHSAGYIALLAGGCVRDALLQKEPKDHDVATSATPEQVVALFPKAQTVGAHFGVVVVWRGGHQIEIATFREDGSYSDGRRPDSVTFSTPEQDAQRRDFTVNGLFENPVSGEIIDYVGGRQDLADQVLRAIGDPHARFEEDRLRLMRAIRFATVLGFEIHPDTWAAVCELAPLIDTVAMERVREELSRILVHPQRVRGFDLLVESGLMARILPEILVLQGCEQPPQFHPEGDVFIHTRLMLSHLPADASLSLVLSVLLHDIAKPATQTRDEDTGRIRFNGHDKLGAEMSEPILRRLKYPNDVIDSVVEAVTHHMIFKDITKMRTSKLKRFMARPNYELEMQLHRVDCLGCHGSLKHYDYLREKEQEFAAQPLIPERLITGADLIQHGFSPGKAMGELLTQVQNLQLEGELTTREEALEWLSKLGKETS
jgi:putative nucleotidyltransferase with HDIG domain